MRRHCWWPPGSDSRSCLRIDKRRVTVRYVAHATLCGMDGPVRTQNPRHALGERAEARVADWLSAHGWRILGRRARLGGGELDLVAIDPRGVLVGVEVRARRGERTGAPGETLDRAGIARRRHALAAYAADAPPHRGLRLDLVSVVPAAGGWRLSRLAGIDAA